MSAESLNKFFEENAKTPTAWSVGLVSDTCDGYHVRFSVAKEIYSEYEKLCKDLAAKYKLRVLKEGNLVVFAEAPKKKFEGEDK